MTLACAAARARAGAFVTLPVRMQRVQARDRRTVPSTTARTDFRFRCHFRLVTLFAWLMLRPVIGVFPQN